MSSKNITALIFVYLLSTLYFFSPTDMDTKVFKAITYILFILLLALSFIYKKKYSSYNYRMSYGFILLAIIISIYSSFINWDQPIIYGIMTSFLFITYSFYFVIHRLNVKGEDLEKTILIITGIYLLLFTISLISFPVVYFGTAENEYARGGIRVRLEGNMYLYISFFMLINKYKINKNKYYILGIIVCYTFILLSLTRQHILVCTILGTLFMFKNVKFYYKIIAVVILLTVLLFIVPEIPFVKKITQMTEEQFEKNNSYSEDIRLSAGKFFLYSFNNNYISILFGNGVPSFGNTSYGNYMERLMTQYHFYIADVGFFGFYYLFGLIGVLGLALLFYKAIAIKTNNSKLYTKYFMALVLFTGFTSGSVVYQGQLITLCLATYLSEK